MNTSFTGKKVLNIPMAICRFNQINPNPMSEIKQINTGVAELLAVKVPEKSCWFETRPGQGIAPPVLVYNFGPNKFMSEVVHLPPGNWITVGIDTELTEEQCREVVGSEKVIVQGVYPIVTYSGMETANEVLASLMEENECYSVNPFGEKEPEDISDLGALTVMIRKKHRLWKECQPHVGSWLILKRI